MQWAATTHRVVQGTTAKLVTMAVVHMWATADLTDLVMQVLSCFQFNFSLFCSSVAFGALTLLVGQQKGHMASKQNRILVIDMLVVVT